MPSGSRLSIPAIRMGLKPIGKTPTRPSPPYQHQPKKPLRTNPRVPQTFPRISYSIHTDPRALVGIGPLLNCLSKTRTSFHTIRRPRKLTRTLFRLVGVVSPELHRPLRDP